MSQRQPVVATIALLALGLGLSIAVAAPASAYTKPDTTTSIYEHSADLTTIDAQADAQAANGRSGLVILDFSRPGYDLAHGGSGAFDFGGHENNFATITAAVEEYARRWYLDTGSSPHLNVAFGINNSYTVNSGNCPCGYMPTDLYRWGQQFGTAVNTISNYITAHYSSQVTGTSANDAEPGFDPEYTDTANVFNGYNNTGLPAIYDYGSMESGFWTQSEEYAVAFGGASNFSVPEIYYSSQPPEWENLVLYARSEVECSSVGS